MRAGRAIAGLAVLVGFWAAGEGIARTTGLPVPGNVLGMLLLFTALSLKWVRLEWLDRAADGLLNHLGFFFVPPGVGVMLHWGLIRREWFPILTAFVLSTLAVLAVTGWVARAAHKEPRT